MRSRVLGDEPGSPSAPHPILREGELELVRGRMKPARGGQRHNATLQTVPSVQENLGQGSRTPQQSLLHTRLPCDLEQLCLFLSEGFWRRQAGGVGRR